MHTRPTTAQSSHSLQPDILGLAQWSMPSVVIPKHELTTSVANAFDLTRFRMNCAIEPKVMHAARGVPSDAVHWTRVRPASFCRSTVRPGRRECLCKSWQLPTHLLPRCCSWWFSSEIATMKAYANSAEPQAAQRIGKRTHLG